MDANLFLVDEKGHDFNLGKIHFILKYLRDYLPQSKVRAIYTNDSKN